MRPDRLFFLSTKAVETWGRLIKKAVETSPIGRVGWGLMAINQETAKFGMNDIVLIIQVKKRRPVQKKQGAPTRSTGAGQGPARKGNTGRLGRDSAVWEKLCQ